MIPAAAAAALPATTAIVDSRRTFTSCGAAISYLHDLPEVGSLRYRISYGYTRTPSRGPHAPYRTRFTVQDPIVTLPLWAWNHGSAADAAAFARFRSNVLEHEAGHWRIAASYAEQVPRAVELPARTTRSQAARYFAGLFGSMIAALQQRQDAYDALTEHGRAQDRALPDAPADGGALSRDTMLRCTAKSR